MTESELSISDVKPYEKNGKKHPESQIKALYAVVKKFGWRQSSLVNQKGVLIVGHGRFITWEKYKDELPPIWIMDDRGRTVHGAPATEPMTDEEAMAYRIADNKLNESEWNMEIVIGELKGLSVDLLDLTGFSADLVLESAEDDIPEVPKVPKTRAGEIFKLGNHRLMCGDSTKREDVEKLMGGMRADILVTDPPYNVDYTGKTKDALKIENDSKTNDEFCRFLSLSAQCRQRNETWCRILYLACRFGGL